MNGNLKIVEKLIECGADINATDKNGRTALFYVEDNEKIVEKLIECGADIKATAINGQTALFYAVRNDNLKIVEKLIECGADVNATITKDQTALFYAVENEKQEMVRKLIECGADIKATDPKGKTVLFSAVVKKNVKIVEKLIKCGADINTSDKNGETALFVAVRKGNEKIVEKLIDCGADINASDNYGATALFDSVWKGNEKIIKKLIDSGANIDARDKNGETALFYAVEYENQDMVQILIECGADINVRDNCGATSLFYAAVKKNVKIVEKLIKCGAVMNASDKHGKTALFYAVEKSNNEGVVRALIDAGSKVNLIDNERKTALFFVNSQRSLIMAIILIEDGGAQVDVRDRYGRTPLFYAMTQSLSLARYLLDKGASLYLDENCSVVTYLIEKCSFSLQGKTPSLERGLNLLIECKVLEKKRILEAIASVAFCKTLYFKPGSCDINVDSLSELMQMAKENTSNSKLKFLMLKGRSTMISNITTIIHKEYHDKRLIESGAALKLTQLLMKLGANPNTTDSDGNTALHHATQLAFLGVTQESVMRICQQLQKLNVSFHIANHQNETPLLYCLTRTIEKVSREEEPWPAVKTQAAVCRFLIKHGSSVEEETSSGQTVLNLTFKLLQQNVFKRESELRKNISHAVLELLEVFLFYNPNITDSDGNNAFHYVIQLALHGVTQKSVMEICQQLHNLKVYFNIKNHRNETPLLYCLTRTIEKMSREEEAWPAVKRQVAVCRFLVEHGSSVEEKTANGETVLHLIIKLLQHGFSKLNSEARKDISVAVLELLELFLNAFKRPKDSVNTQDNSGNTPLHLWAKLQLAPTQDYSSNITEEYTFNKLVTTILDNILQDKEQLNSRNKDGETPLHLCGTWTAVELLLDAGASSNEVDSSGRTPLLVAARNNESVLNRSTLYPDILLAPDGFWKTVLQKGLDPWTFDVHDESLLSLLMELGSHDLARALIDVACEDVKVKSRPLTLFPLLNAICRDKLPNAQWKKDAAEVILSSTKCPVNGNAKEDSPLHYCCRNIIEALNSSFIDDVEKTVHWSMVKLLRSFGADYRIPDAADQSCLDIADKCPSLKDLLMEPIDLDRFPVLIKPWKSVSKTHERFLARVARNLECEAADSYWYHKDHLAKGSFGAVFAGISKEDGREVAIKRIEKIRMQRPKDKREITNLTELADCEQVLLYLHFFEDKHFSYIVLELMEGNLEEFLDTAIRKDTKVSLCQDVVKGIRFLHQHNIIHRDLKPMNILYKTHPKLCLKIADFGLSRRIDSTSTTVYGTNAGTRCWIAPEVLKATKAHSKSSDMFACGLVLHYILSGKKHPFTPADCANKSDMQINHGTEANILNDKMEGWDDSLCPKGVDLLKAMLDGDESKRLSADKALDHPFFWTEKKKQDFLTAVGNQPEFECPRARRTLPLAAVEIDLETSFGTIVKYVDWNDPRYAHMPTIYTEMTKKRKRYDTHFVVELVRFIRNAYAHVTELPKPIQDQLLKHYVFFEYFPNLVMEVYKAVTTHGWDQNREEIKHALK